ncbi:uncharacterized protein LOC109829144 isoform X2 [Asparagus officinalis]|uniref:uncharacterized protein LOC109829144 isoform X2 n=1 Tax=Asparagus officinalis TaxID=4686 RepID=UPI00098E689C|nr:uncharacterized protein LOC109829144 isoform X2 [Asparagus officinalis]
MEDNQNVSILLFDEDTADNLLIRIINMAAQIGGLVTSISHLISQEEINLPISQLRHGITDLGLQYLKFKMDSNPRDFRRVYRMYPDCFMKLCMVLRERGHLQDTRYISVEEMVAIFLLTVTQNQRYCITTERFDRSRFAVSVCFNKALQALVSLAPCMMAPPPTDPPEKVTSESRFWTYFKDCIGAIDGTHIPLGWEGSANDSRVLKDAMSRSACSLPLPNGKFYLVDCGYPNRLQFLAPYRGTRYHLKEFGPANNRQRPRNAHELFNHRHSSLRNCIERIFGIFKSRFTIFKSQPPGFPYETQKSMIWACIGLHNFLKMENSNDDFEVSDLPPEAPRNVAPIDGDSDEDDDLQTQQAQRTAASRWREQIANTMWEDGTNVAQGV